MKKTVFFLCAVALATMSFTLLEPTMMDYPDGIHEELAEFLDSEYLTTIENRSLKKDLEEKFFFLFDEINEIHVQHSDANGYYYLLFVEKDGASTLEMLKIEEKDYRNETYSYIDFSNIEVNEFTQLCSRGIVSTNPLICPPDCDFYTIQCLGISCGVYIGGQCVQQ